jgi:protein-S-isoprenylcysteine O-methyltransferase Ste14
MINAKLKAWLWLAVSYALIALVLFLSAGTMNYWQAWVFLAVGAGASIPLTIHISNDPRLSENRTKAGPAVEQRPIQKIIVLASGLPAVAAFIVPGLDRRFGWSDMPPWLSIAGDLMILAAMRMAFRVFRENAFGSATVEVAGGQKVISTGPYAVVRHPMYASAAVYFVGAALALGSAWGLVPALLTIAGLVFRLFDEEGFLAANLPGYTDYCAKVRWRLMPGIF